jgi:hypothetical protein
LTTVGEVSNLIEAYVRWLRDKTSLRQHGDLVEITTPFLDRHNDFLQVYVRKLGAKFVVSDDGYVLADLELSGCRLDTPKRQELLRTTLNGFGVKDTNGRLEVDASVDNFSLKKHSLVQAMLAVNDLFYVSQGTVHSLFYEDVVSWLDEAEIRYTARVKFTGQSGYDHLFDFVIPRSKNAPERVVQALNMVNRSTAQNFAFSWMDTKQTRSRDSVAIAFLNDTVRPPPDAATDALRSYGITPALWRERDQMRDQLVA